MSALNYSKWDNIELSDDEDVEVHPNIDKASWIRWKQQDIHRKREERKMKIAALRQEHKTNNRLKEIIQEKSSHFKAATEDEGRKLANEIFQAVMFYEKERKPKIFDENSDEYLQPKDEYEVFNMLISRLAGEQKIESTADDYFKKLPDVLVNELPKLDLRQKEVLETIASEEEEQNKKLTSDNMYHDGFSKTIVNPKSVGAQPVAFAPSSPKKGKTTELLNPGFADVSKNKSMVTAAKKAPDVDLRELTLMEEKLLLEFASKESFEQAFSFIQKHPEIVSKVSSDHLMARAFKKQMEDEPQEAFRCAKWSLAISYSLQMGTDGVGLFFQRMLKGGPQALEVFETDLGQTYARIVERSKVLAAKEKEISEENSNLTPEQAAAFKTFPKHFQEALFSNEIEKINASMSRMGEKQAAEVWAKCQEVGLISVLSEEEAAKYKEGDTISK